MERASKLASLSYLDGEGFCMVQMTVLDETTNKVKLVPYYGTARVAADGVFLTETSGATHAIPDSALVSIHPSDGTDILKDSAYYVIVKIATLGE